MQQAVKRAQICKAIALAVVVAAVILAGCRKTTVVPVPTQAATRSPVSQATPTPLPSETPTPTPGPYDWQPISLDGLVGVAAQGDNPNCARLYPDLDADEFVLGPDPQTCEPLLRWVQVDLQAHIDVSAQGDWVALRITCAGESSCMGSGVFEPGTGSASFDLFLEDGTRLWSSSCGKEGICQPDGDHRPVEATLRKPASGVINLSLMTAVGAVWRIASIEAALLPPLDQSLIQGYAYSPFRNCQMPDTGPYPTNEDVREDLLRLANSAAAIRTYSSQGINAEIARQAQEMGFQLGIGVAIGADDDKNQAEIEAAGSLVQQVRPEFLIVGNEVILRGEKTPLEMASYMAQVKQLTGLPVAYAEIGSFFVQAGAGGELVPRADLLPIIDSADILLVHLYPYWDGISVEQGAAYVVGAYQTLVRLFPDKRVVIGETGWPSQGETRGSAVPSLENQRRFFLEFTALAAQEGVEYFYFSPFDEPWKANEGQVGPSWGVVAVERDNKFESESLYFPRPVPQEAALAGWPPAGGSPTESAPAPTAGKQATPPPLVLYREFPFLGSLSPSRWQGDVEDIHMNPCYGVSVYSSPDALQLEYTAESAGISEAKGWAGFTWESTGEEGRDLSAYNQVRFYARGDQGGEKVTFFFGGERSNLAACQQGLISCDAQTLPPMLPVTLTRDWQLYSLDLGDQPLSAVVDGLGWVASACQNPGGATFFLDDVELVSGATPVVQDPQPFVVLEGGCIAPGFDLGIDTSEGERQWASPAEGALRLVYPVGQDWGAAFAFVDLAEWEHRAYIDLSDYSILEVELRGTGGREQIQVGMKDNDDPDDGNEPKRWLTLQWDWKTYQFTLVNFRYGRYADPARIYIPMELVFGRNWSGPVEVYIRSARLLP